MERMLDTKLNHNSTCRHAHSQERQERNLEEAQMHHVDPVIRISARRHVKNRFFFFFFHPYYPYSLVLITSSTCKCAVKSNIKCRCIYSAVKKRSSPRFSRFFAYFSRRSRIENGLFTKRRMPVDYYYYYLLFENH